MCPTLCTPWSAACEASLSFTISQKLLIFTSIDSVLLSKQHILCHSLSLLPLILASRSFSMSHLFASGGQEYWSFSFSISPSNEFTKLIYLGLTSLILLSRGLSRVFSNTTVQKHEFFGTQPSLWSNSHIHT